MTRMLRILVVDDEPKVGQGLKLSLERAMQCQVFAASNGKDALSQAQEILPDVILLDVMMPGMAGGEVAEALQEHELTKGIPVIFLTGLVDKQELAARGGEVGGKRYVAKPATVGEIKQAIHAALSLPH